MRPEATFRPGSFPPSRFPRRPSPYLRRQGGTTDTRAAAAAPSRTQSRDRRGGRRYVGDGRLGGLGGGRDAGDRRALAGGAHAIGERRGPAGRSRGGAFGPGGGPTPAGGGAPRPPDRPP